MTRTGAVIVTLVYLISCQKPAVPELAQPAPLPMSNAAAQFEEQKLVVLEMELASAKSEARHVAQLLKAKAGSESLTNLERMALETRLREAKDTIRQVDIALKKQRDEVTNLKKAGN